MIRFLIVIFAVLKGTSSLADAAPKLHPQVELKFWQDEDIVSGFDSICIFTHLLEGRSPDTLFLNKWWNDYDGSYPNQLWYYGTDEEGVYEMHLYKPIADFQIYVQDDGKGYLSDILSYKGNRSFHEFILSENGKIIDAHNLFYAPWLYYFISLCATIVLEFLVALVLIKTMAGQFTKFLLVVLIVNFVSHPLLWFFNARLDTPLYVLELSVMVLEIVMLHLFYRKFLKLGDVIFFGVLANLISWWIGGIIAYVLYILWGA